MGSTPLFTTYRMGIEGLWLCDPSGQGLNLTCIQKDSEYWTYKQKVEGANQSSGERFKMLIGIIKVPTAEQPGVVLS